MPRNPYDVVVGRPIFFFIEIIETYKEKKIPTDAESKFLLEMFAFVKHESKIAWFMRIVAMFLCGIYVVDPNGAFTYFLTKTFYRIGFFFVGFVGVALAYSLLMLIIITILTEPFLFLSRLIKEYFTFFSALMNMHKKGEIPKDSIWIKLFSFGYLITKGKIILRVFLAMLFGGIAFLLPFLASFSFFVLLLTFVGVICFFPTVWSLALAIYSLKRVKDRKAKVQEIPVPRMPNNIHQKKDLFFPEDEPDNIFNYGNTTEIEKVKVELYAWYNPIGWFVILKEKFFSIFFASSFAKKESLEDQILGLKQELQQITSTQKVRVKKRKGGSVYYEEISVEEYNRRKIILLEKSLKEISGNLSEKDELLETQRLEMKELKKRVEEGSKIILAQEVDASEEFEEPEDDSNKFTAQEIPAEPVDDEEDNPSSSSAIPVEIGGESVEIAKIEEYVSEVQIQPVDLFESMVIPLDDPDKQKGVGSGFDTMVLPLGVSTSNGKEKQGRDKKLVNCQRIERKKLNLNPKLKTKMFEAVSRSNRKKS